MKTDKIVQKLVDSYGSWVQEEKENCPGPSGWLSMKAAGKLSPVCVM